eukprot:356347-Chlamydomonas_euryale.AAC.6
MGGGMVHTIERSHTMMLAGRPGCLLKSQACAYTPCLHPARFCGKSKCEAKWFHAAQSIEPLETCPNGWRSVLLTPATQISLRQPKGSDGVNLLIPHHKDHKQSKKEGKWLESLSGLLLKRRRRRSAVDGLFACWVPL